MGLPRSGAEPVKITAEPRSDQLNADSFGKDEHRTYTIAAVKKGKAEQPYDIELTESPDRVWRPPVTVLRILKDAWGDEGDDWVGHRVTLYRDDEVKFGKEQTGGIRVSHLSHINGPLRIAVTVTRGKKKGVTILPLPDAPAARDWVTEARQFTTVDDIRNHWVEAKAGGATPQQLADIQALATTTQQEEQQ